MSTLRRSKKRLLAVLVAGLMPVVVTGASTTITPQLDDLISAGKASPAVTVPPVRQQFLRDAAFEAGVKIGRYDRGREWRGVFDQRTREFEEIYRFGELTLPGGDLPPVIEATGGPAGEMSVNVKSDALVVAAMSYKIIRPSRFAATAPTWRTYVLQGLDQKIDQSVLPHQAVRPANDAEQSIWVSASKEGYAEGRRLADATVKANLARLNRDYFGTLTYFELLSKGWVSPSLVGADRAVVVGDRQSMEIDKTTVRIESPAGLNSDSRMWRK